MQNRQSTHNQSTTKAEPDRFAIMRIAKLLHAGRKHLGLNQTAVAPHLGLDQSALSRIESGKQMLNATQWFTFCQLTGISPNALATGTIEISQPESAIRLPARYSFQKHTKVRSLLPLLDFARTSLGEQALQMFFNEKQIDPDFFINLDAAINFNFNLDLLEALARRSGMTSKDAEAASRTISEKSTHGSLHYFYDQVISNPLMLIQGYLTSASRYASNFNYETLEASKDQMDVAVTALPHMKEFNYLNNPILDDFLAHYDRGLFQNLSTYGGQKPLKIVMLENLYKGDQRCLYRIKASGH